MYCNFQDSLGNYSYSQIEGPTLENSRGFKVNSDNYGDAQVKHEVWYDYLCLVLVYFSN